MESVPDHVTEAVHFLHQKPFFYDVITDRSIGVIACLKPTYHFAAFETILCFPFHIENSTLNVLTCL